MLLSPQTAKQTISKSKGLPRKQTHQRKQEQTGYAKHACFFLFDSRASCAASKACHTPCEPKGAEQVGPIPTPLKTLRGTPLRKDESPHPSGMDLFQRAPQDNRAFIQCNSIDMRLGDFPRSGVPNVADPRRNLLAVNVDGMNIYFHLIVP